MKKSYIQDADDWCTRRFTIVSHSGTAKRTTRHSETWTKKFTQKTLILVKILPYPSYAKNNKINRKKKYLYRDLRKNLILWMLIMMFWRLQDTGNISVKRMKILLCFSLDIHKLDDFFKKMTNKWNKDICFVSYVPNMDLKKERVLFSYLNILCIYCSM